MGRDHHATKNGFTLWEVMLVIILLSTITFLTIPSYLSTAEKVKAEAHRSNVLNIERAVQLYYQDSGSLPLNIEALVKRPLSAVNWRGPYLEAVPQYPYDNEKIYALDPYGNITLK